MKKALEAAQSAAKEFKAAEAATIVAMKAAEAAETKRRAAQEKAAAAIKQAEESGSAEDAAKAEKAAAAYKKAERAAIKAQEAKAEQGRKYESLRAALAAAIEAAEQEQEQEQEQEAESAEEQAEQEAERAEEQAAPAPTDTTDASQPATDGQPVADAATSDTDASQPAPAAASVPAYTSDQVAQYAAQWVAQYASNRAIRADWSALVGQHGKANAAAIFDAVRIIRAAVIDNATKAAAANLSYSSILAAAWDTLAKGGHWAKACSAAASEYADAAQFVAACYPNTIDGKPAAGVYYTNGTTIFKAYQPAKTTSRNAVAILETALTKFSKRAQSWALKATDGRQVVATTKRTAGVIVGVYSMDTDAATGKAVRGAAIKGDQRNGHKVASDWPTLADYNKDTTAAE